MGKIVNKRELSEILGKSQRALSIWQNEGLPYEIKKGKGKENKYDTAKVINWIRELDAKNNVTDLELERTRLLKSQADEKELHIKQLDGELVNLRDVVKAWVDIAIYVRTRFRNLPDKLALQLSQEDAPERIHEILVDEIGECLRSIGENPPRLNKKKNARSSK